MPTSVAFFGSHPLGERCLDRLVDHPEVSVDLVVTYPADYDGWWDGSLWDRATDHGLDVRPVEDERDLLDVEVDWLLSVHYPNVLDGDLLDHPAEGALNLHQAELPRYRGANMFTHAIRNARPDDHWQYGTTMHFMVEKVDAGDIVARKFLDIRETDTARTLYDRTETVSVELFEELLPAIVSGAVHGMGTPQDEFDGERYYYSKASLDGEKLIPAAELAAAEDDPEAELELYDRVRSLDFPPHEPAHTELGGRTVYLTTSGYEEPNP
ncbi:formyltransferase family protein [Halobium salinum]|uniref:Formyltransferase family protein n=1 Tax=Halobium salinum TaxID=1364940 RepID=A0ABD5PCI7_9EURY|nr:formyltransferase family protein [Halobium salinum]